MLELYINSISSEPSQFKNKSPKVFSDKTGTEELTVKSEKTISLQEKRALEFLTQNHMLYDLNLALVICQLHNFRVYSA